MFKNMSKVTCTHWFEFFVRLVLLIGLLISYLMNVHIFGVSLFGLLLKTCFIEIAVNKTKMLKNINNKKVRNYPNFYFFY